MLLTSEEADLFFKLNKSLMFYVSQRLNLISGISDSYEFSFVANEDRAMIRDALIDELHLIDEFVAENPENLTDSELEIVLSWYFQIPGKFMVFRQLKKHMVILSTGKPDTAYGVLALTQSFEEVVGHYLPKMVNAVLLPFNGKIIYDGLISHHNLFISFGGGAKRMLNKCYREAKRTGRMFTSLPLEDSTDIKGGVH